MNYPINPKKTVIVAGYPKSGNTWLTRLIADYLDSPISPLLDALPICAGEYDRKGNWYITQQHVVPENDENCKLLLPHPRALNVNVWNGEQVVYIRRDPRAVAISAMHYWETFPVSKTLQLMRDAAWPICFDWNGYNRAWLSENRFPFTYTTYRALYLNTEKELTRILYTFGLAVDFERVAQVVARQKFDVKRKEIEKDGLFMPYGQGIQLKNMRRGQLDSWRGEFTQADLDLAWEYFGEVMKMAGYQR